MTILVLALHENHWLGSISAIGSVITAVIMAYLVIQVFMIEKNTNSMSVELQRLKRQEGLDEGMKIGHEQGVAEEKSRKEDGAE